MCAFACAFTGHRPARYIFGYDEEGDYRGAKPREIPWSRVGSSSILDSGWIDSRDGDDAIYQIAEDGCSVVRISKAEPYDYESEANKAEAKWRFYINDTEVEYDFYADYLTEQGYSFERNNALMDIEWTSIY
jgi:hypothetical protein